MCLKIWDYDTQMNFSSYKYNNILGGKFGLSSASFFNQNLKPMFKRCDFTTEEKLMKGIHFRWDFINENDYQTDTLIGLGGYGLGAHYFLIIGVDKTK